MDHLRGDIHLSLVHHYRVHKRGLPHIAFRKNYLSQLHALLPLPVGLPPARVVSPDSSGLLCLGDSPEVLRGPTRTTIRAHRRRRPVRVEEPAVGSVPVFMIQDPLAAAGAVVLDCRSIDPGTDLEDELLTPVGSPLAAVDEYMPLSPTSGVYVDVARALLEVGVLPAMVMPIIDPAVGSSMSPATYPMPPVPMMSIGNSIPLEVAPPADLAVGSPARSEIPLRRVASPASVASSGLPPSSSVLRPAPDVDPPSGLAAIEQELLPLGLSVDSPLLPAPLTPSRMVEGGVAPESVLFSPAGGTDVAGSSPELPDLSLEGPFDVHPSPHVLDGMQGCQYRMTSYDQESGVQLHDPRLLEYVGALESARLLSRSPEYWLHHLGHENTLAAALELQRDTGLLLSNVQVLQQFVTSLNRTSSEVMRVTFGRAPFPADAMQQVVPSYRVRRAAHYMAAMGLWHPPSSQGVWGTLPLATCNACMSCSDCFPDLQ